MELNKIAAAIILAGLISMFVGKVASALYEGGETGGHHGEASHEEKRGYTIAGAEAFENGGGGAAIAAAGSEELASIIPLLSSADVAAGETFFKKKCATCHTAEKGGSAKTGPNLYNIVNRDKAGFAGFKYSSALAEAEGNWTYDDLNGFLHKPKKFLSGTIMAFAGIRKDEDRADLIAYLRTQSDSLAPIPKVEAPAEEAPAEEASKEASAEETATEEAPAEAEKATE